jgi:hypothetical protein
MLFADLVKYQTSSPPEMLQTDFAFLVSLLQVHYGEGLGNFEEKKNCILLAGTAWSL